MGRRQHPAISGFDVLTFEVPKKRDLRMTRSEYQPIGSLYSHYRHLRKTWVNEFQWPWGRFEKPALADFLKDADSFAASILAFERPSQPDPLVTAMAKLAPALLDERDDWRLFRETMGQIRESFEPLGPTFATFDDNESGRQIFLSHLHRFQKAVPVTSALQKSLRSVLFGFARDVGGRKNWKRPFNHWEHGVTVAQRFEFNDFHWTHRACLIQARFQMVTLGRALNATDGSNEAFHRTRIRNRASIIHEISRLNTGENLPFTDLIERIRESRRTVNWEAYLNKLPNRSFPKKAVHSG